MNQNNIPGTEKPELLALVRRCLLFSELNAEQLEEVMRRTRLAQLDEGEILFEQQQPAHELFLLESGQIKLARYSPDGHEKIIDLVSPGGSFAEAITFARQPAYPVTATAIAPSRVICFNSKTYADVLRQSTDACFAVMAHMSRRLHGHISEIDRLTLHNATYRVIAYLVDQIPSTHLGTSEMCLDTPKHVIAARLSITPETLSRCFSKLGRDGLITMADNTVTLNDVGRLREYIQGGPL